MLAGLPTKLNTCLSNIHFLTCSDSDSVLEMAEPIVEELLHLEREGTEVYDAHLQCNVLAVAPLLCAISDNPQASEMVNHLRGAASKFMVTDQLPVIHTANNTQPSISHLYIIHRQTRIHHNHG